jgi:hypothetical protein
MENRGAGKGGARGKKKRNKRDGERREKGSEETR